MILSAFTAWKWLSTLTSLFLDSRDAFVAAVVGFVVAVAAFWTPSRSFS
jgi:hypothetical protein